MSQNTRIAAIIPARMASSRFPGKPLLEIRGLPMVEHVRRRTLLCKGFSDVVVATCNREIETTVKSFGGKVAMTSDKHVAATDRVAEAMDQLDCTHVINVQGDEILVLPDDLSKMITAIKENPEVSAWNAIANILDEKELSDLSVVKCVTTQSNRIMYCARNFSSLPFKNGSFEPVRIILGILAYRRSFLKQYLALARTPLESIESIDQSRILEHDIPLRAVSFSKGYPGINEPREVELVEKYFNDDPQQKEILKQIL